MNYKIRELRDKVRMTQKAFAERYGIPLSTLRKWEQGEAAPADYIVRLIAETLPRENDTCRLIRCKDGVRYYYDKLRKTVTDEKGNEIRIKEDLDTVKEQNLPIYLEDLFEGFYQAQERFERDCRFDRVEDIIWSSEKSADKRK